MEIEQTSLFDDDAPPAADFETWGRMRPNWTQAELMERYGRLPPGELALQAARVLEGRKDSKVLGRALARMARLYKLPMAGDRPTGKNVAEYLAHDLDLANRRIAELEAKLAEES